MPIPRDYRETLRRLAPLGAPAVLKNANGTIVSGMVRGSERPGVLEFHVQMQLIPAIPIESATALREIGGFTNKEFELDSPPEYNAAGECWDLEFFLLDSR